MEDKRLWTWKVRDDEIIIAPTDAGRFELRLNGQTIGSFPTAEAAAKEAVFGSTHPDASSTLRTADLSPSDSLADWVFTSGKPE